MNIAEAAKTVLQDSSEAMTPADIHAEIVKRNLFKFGAKSPVSVVSSTLRKKSDADPKAKQVLFHMSEKGKYKLV